MQHGDGVPAKILLVGGVDQLHKEVRVVGRVIGQEDDGLEALLAPGFHQGSFVLLGKCRARFPPDRKTWRRRQSESRVRKLQPRAEEYRSRVFLKHLGYAGHGVVQLDRKSTRLNSSHLGISY